MSSSLKGFRSFAKGAALVPKLPVVCLFRNPHDADCGGDWNVSEGEPDVLSVLVTCLLAELPLAFCIFIFSVRADGGISVAEAGDFVMQQEEPACRTGNLQVSLTGRYTEGVER